MTCYHLYLLHDTQVFISQGGEDNFLRLAYLPFVPLITGTSWLVLKSEFKRKFYDFRYHIQSARNKFPNCFGCEKKNNVLLYHVQNIIQKDFCSPSAECLRRGTELLL